jgi:hypothetical protein
MQYGHGDRQYDHPINSSLQYGHGDRPEAYLFIETNTSTNPIVVTLTEPLNFNRWFLVEYTIDGVPVTSTIPDVTHYQMKIEDIAGFTNRDYLHSSVAGNTLANIVPVFLTAEYTHQLLTPPRLISRSQVSHIRNFRIRLTNPDGTDATFSQCAFLFLYKNV